MNRFIEKLLSRKGLFAAFWGTAIFMVTALVYYTANLAKEVPPIPAVVSAADGTPLYTRDDVVQGKALFQQFDLMDYGTMLGMGAYLGPDFSTEFMHARALALYDAYGQSTYGKPAAELSDEERALVKVKVIADVRGTVMADAGTTYTAESAAAFRANQAWLTRFLVDGNPEWAWPGGVIRPAEAALIATFVDWSQLVASSLRPGTDRTWSNNWPPEPLLDQDGGWHNHVVSLWEFLLLWPASILVVFLAYTYLFKREDDEECEPPLEIKTFLPSQKKLLKYVPLVALFIVLQMVLGGYLAHIYTEPSENFLISQAILPFNVMRALHTNLAIVWVTIGWLVGGMLIAPWVGGRDLRFPWLVDVLWAALIIVGVGGLTGIYLGATGHLRDAWFWLGNEGRELLNLARVWDIGLVIGLVLWFFMVFSLVRKAEKNSVMVGTIIWSAFGIATLYIAGMMPVHKIMPNFTVDDYYRWWVVHLWVELTFELFAAGVLAYVSVALGLVPRRVAERVMLFELVLVAMSGTLGVGHHYWWQGLDEYWIAIGGLFSALEPLPLVLLMIEAIRERRHIAERGGDFAFGVPFMWLAGSAVLNFYGAGFLGMVINTPTISYYSHGTYLIMPHGHVALLGAFGYIAIAFIYLTARANALAEGLVWTERWSKVGFWLITVGVVLFSIPTLVIGFEQSRVAAELGYHAARARETVEAMSGWMWFRVLPDLMMIGGAVIVFFDTLGKTWLAKKKKVSAS